VTERILWTVSVTSVARPNQERKLQEGKLHLTASIVLPFSK
jgi:hypothetical protein